VALFILGNVIPYLNRTDAQAKGEPAHVIVGTFWPVTLALLPLPIRTWRARRGTWEAREALPTRPGRSCSRK